jgi:hypothetical protein
LKETAASPPDVAAVDAAMTPLREVRNNWISHADLQTALADRGVTVILSDIRNAAQEVLAWLRQFGQMAGLVTSDPVDQGSWNSAVSLTSAVRDQRAVREAYVDLLRACASKCPAAEAVDRQLTARRAAWEDSPFSEMEWLKIQEWVSREGLANVRNSIDPLSPYQVILLQAESPESEITINYTDRRVASRIQAEAERLRKKLTG